ncbi:hypothetical protein RJ55_01976 [Drechmeria coniospora]|nr:hypothetical protein RJ55_01976 [Drechmeria coniospora]
MPSSKMETVEATAQPVMVSSGRVDVTKSLLTRWFNGAGNVCSDQRKATAKREIENVTNGNDHDSDSDETDHIEKKKMATIIPRKQGFLCHVRRFWPRYLIATICLLAIFLPILFKVVIPAVVQCVLSGQGLPIHGGTFQALSASQLILSLNTSLNSPIAATIDSVPLYLYNRNTSVYSPFLNLGLPEQHVKGTTPATISNQTVTIINETELVRWFGQVFDEATVELSVRGNPTVRLGALSSSPSLDRTISLPALSSLGGIAIQNLEIVLPPDAEGNNVRGSIVIPNTAVLTIGLGNVTLNLISGDINLGYVNLYDLVLPPGNSTRFFAGQVYLKSILSNLGALLQTQSVPLAQGNIQLNATGNATVVNGEHIKFIEAVLNNRKLPLTIPVLSLLSSLVGGFIGGKGKPSIFDSFAEMVGNATFLEHVADHWDKSAVAGQDMTEQFKRISPRARLASNMLKLGMRMRMGKR